MKNWKYLLVSLVLLLFTLSSGCVYIGNAPSPVPAPSTSNMTAPPTPGWTLPPVGTQSPLLPDFVSVVVKIRPSVVAINTEVVTYDIFNRPFTEEGAGSGWVLDKNGLIATNNHVIEGAKSITVTLSDGRTFTAGVVGTDVLSDLAVLKVDDGDLPAAVIGDSSKLQIGEWVLAVGNALGEGITVKEGIVSRLGVSIPMEGGQTLYDLIDTSAPINPGNSGGPLVNMAGEVIGITSAKLAAVDVEGLGYAISTSTAGSIIEELVQRGYVIRPWLGVVVSSVDEWLALRYNLSVDKGAFVTDVSPGSPAEKAGIKSGDIIVGLGGAEINDADELIRAIHAAQIGQEVKITYWRGTIKNTSSAVLIEKPNS